MTSPPAWGLGNGANYAYVNSQTVTTGSAIYVAGGGYNAGGPNRDHATILKVNPTTGAIDSVTTSQFPAPYDPELGGAVITQAGYFYAFGGDSPSGTPLTYDTVVYAKVQVGGDLGAFAATLSLPNPNAAGTTGWWFPGVCSIGNYIITNVGIPTTTANTDVSAAVYVATTDPSTGAITAWTKQTNSLPQPIYGAQLVAVNDTIFAIGGRTTNGVKLNTVYRALFNAGTGTVGAWQQVDAQLPNFTHYHDITYSAQAKCLFLTSYRAANPAATDLGIQNAILISSPLFARDPSPTAADKSWSLYE